MKYRMKKQKECKYENDHLIKELFKKKTNALKDNLRQFLDFVHLNKSPVKRQIDLIAWKKLY